MTKFTLQTIREFISSLLNFSTTKNKVNKPKMNIIKEGMRSAAAITTFFIPAGYVNAIDNGMFDQSSKNSLNNNYAVRNSQITENSLPSQLANFTASINGNQVEIKWSIQNEITNNYYTIERSLDNNNYYTLGAVDNQDASKQTNNYSFVDYNPIRGISYYRLRQNELDGTSEAFAPTLVNYRGSKTFIVYPNPSSSPLVHLSFASELSKNNVTIQDITGKEIPFNAYPQENGTMDIYIEESYASRGGIFIITVNNGQELLHQRLVIN